MKNEHVGKIFKTLNYGDLEIINYYGNRKVVVKFLDTGYETTVQLVDIRKGTVKDRLVPSVHGVGVLGYEVSRIKGEYSKEYILWQAMLTRCYDSKFHAKRPTYSGCTASENFKYYSYFKEWCKNRVGFREKGWVLDKDILVKGNKVYSEDTCCFVPQSLNLLLTKSDSSRGKLPIGVSQKSNGSLIAVVRQENKMIRLGTFKNKEDAFLKYKLAKESIIREEANRFKGLIDDKVYKALINYEVEIDD